MREETMAFWFNGHMWARPFQVDRLPLAATLGVALGTWVVDTVRESDGFRFMTIPPAEVLAAYEIEVAK